MCLGGTQAAQLLEIQHEHLGLLSGDTHLAC